MEENCQCCIVGQDISVETIKLIHKAIKIMLDWLYTLYKGALFSLINNFLIFIGKGKKYAP